MKRRPLPQVKPEAAGLGQPTIMDRTLAAAHGVDYVHLAVFAIDVDRVFLQTADDVRLPFGWEVFLVLAYVLDRIDGHSEAGRNLLEDAALHVLSADPAEPQLGGVLAFALHAGVERGLLDERLGHAFRTWRSSPKQLRKGLDALLAQPGPALTRAALHCLGTAITPPLAPPTLAALEQMAAGHFRLPDAPAASPPGAPKTDP